MSGLLRPGGGAEEEWADVLLGAGKVQIPVLSLSQGKILFILSGVQTILIGLNSTLKAICFFNVLFRVILRWENTK